MKILIVEDNFILAKNITKYLELQGMKAEFIRTGESALERIVQENFSVIILDLNLPGMDGLMVLKTLRNTLKIDTPVLILTSSSTNEDVIKGLDAGADDYITKPFDYNVLISRINAVTRRNVSNKSELVQIGDIHIDLIFKKIVKSGEIILLSNLEFELLKYLLQNRGKTVTRSEIYENVWGEFESYMFSRVVDIYIGHLRKKLGKDLIQTKKGDGYSIIENNG